MMSRSATLRELIDLQASFRPNQTYLITPETDQQMSYAQLQQHAQDFSQQLAQAGIGKGDKVAMLLDNGYWTVAIMLGAMYSGAVIVPMNAVAGASVLEYVLDHSDSRMLFVSPHYQDKYPKLVKTASAAMPVSVVEQSCFAFNTNTDTAFDSETLEPITPEDAAVLIYTSGTTGRPKGVQLSHKNVLAGAQNTADAHRLMDTDRGLCVLPLYHINAEIVSVLGALVSGGSLVLPPKFSVSSFWTLMAEKECTWFSLVPTIVAYLLDHAEREGIADSVDDYIRTKVRFGRSASAPLSPEMHKAFEEKFSVSLIETMGLTETAAQILSNPLPPGKIKYGSPGVAVGNEAKIIDENGQECSRGVSGELMIRGDNVLSAYYKNEAATNEAITADNWLHTGDLAMQDEEGYFFITGRLKELIIKGGENISPREIDEVLFSHSAVLEAAAFAVDHREYGQEVMACVVLKQDVSVDCEALRAFAETELGKFKAPQQVYIMDELPKGPSGKVQRLKLADLLA
ncbi:MAG: AMP-binding protein [Leucothrix sp.]